MTAVDGKVQHWVRQAEGRWEMVENIGTGVKHVWSLVQGSFWGMMHMITEGSDGSLDYWGWDGGWVVVEKLKGLNEEGWARVVSW